MIRLLMVEDVVPDAELTVRHLKAAGIDCSWERVETEADFRGALQRSQPDLIISDGRLPAFDGLTALSIAACEAPATPFVFVSGTLGKSQAQQALEAGAMGWVGKDDPKKLAAIVRTALERTSPHRRAADNAAHPNARDEATGAAQHLLQRRRVLDEALRHQDESAVANIMRRTPPIPVALLMIDAQATRERFSKLLVGAKVDVEEARGEDDALALLANRIHALLFTDSLEFVRRARQLPAGAATHIVFVNSAGDSGYGDALRAGASDCMPSDARGDKFWANMTIARRIVDFAASLQLALTDNRLLATIDELTHTGSRRFFERQYPREVERAGRLRMPLALVMCDIDHFKRINDRFGHHIGDEVLREFADRLRTGLRAEDWIARTGGEEFAVVLPETGDAGARAIAKRLCRRVNSEPFATSSERIPVTASFGVCAIDRVPRECRGISTAMIKAADAALYQSKHRGRNRVTAAALKSLERLRAGQSNH